MTRLRHIFVEAFVIGQQRGVPLLYGQQETHLLGGQRPNGVQNSEEEAVKRCRAPCTEHPYIVARAYIVGEACSDSIQGICGITLNGVLVHTQ